jgi:PhnB protein
MRMDFYLNYAGTCEQAFRFYERELGGKLTSIMKHGEVATSNVPADYKSKVLHAHLDLGNAALLGADIPQAQPMRSAYVSLTIDREEEADRVYALLAEGGEVFMKMGETFFAKRFAMLRDRFGTSWMLVQGARRDGDTKGA